MADLQQVLRKTSVTVTETFRIDNVPVDIDAGLPTLAIVKPDGTAYTPLPTVSGSWTGRTTGQYRFVLPAQPEVIWLDYELTGNIGGLSQTLGGRVEWVGDYLFNVDELRSYQPIGGSTLPFADTAKYPDAKIHQTRTEVLGEFTKRLGFSPVRRYAYETYSLERPGDAVILKRLFPGKLLSVSVAGVAQTVGDYFVSPGGVLRPVSSYAATSWASSGYGVVAVGYTHGWDSFEDDQGREAALMRASMKLLPSLSSTMTNYSSPDGGNYTWDRAGTRNAAGEKVHFGVGAIAGWINEHSQIGLGVA